MTHKAGAEISGGTDFLWGMAARAALPPPTLLAPLSKAPKYWTGRESGASEWVAKLGPP